MFEYQPNRVRVICKNGASLSVQASHFHYCTPRDNDGPYESVEVGFIENVPAPESFREYADGSFPNDVYSNIPVNIVSDFIEANGGVDWLKTFQQPVDGRRKFNY